MVRVWRMAILIQTSPRPLLVQIYVKERDIKWENEKSDVPRDCEMSNSRSHSFDMPE